MKLLLPGVLCLQAQENVNKRVLHSYLTEKQEEDLFRRRAQEAYIDDQIDEETFRRALGIEELLKVKQLEQLLETLGEGVPAPEDSPDIPSDTAFYGTDEMTVIDIDDEPRAVVRSTSPSDDDT